MDFPFFPFSYHFIKALRCDSVTVFEDISLQFAEPYFYENTAAKGKIWYNDVLSMYFTALLNIILRKFVYNKFLCWFSAWKPQFRDKAPAAVPDEAFRKLTLQLSPKIFLVLSGSFQFYNYMGLTVALVIIIIGPCLKMCQYREA